MTINVLKGDVTRQAADAIINSANPSLLAGGGVCGAIHRAAGPELEAACKAIGRCEIGAAVATPAFGLPAKFVIHAVGPRWLDGTRGEPELLERCYESIFTLASENDLRSLAIPSISTGVYRYPLDAAAEIAIRVALRYNRPESVIQFICFEDETFAEYQSVLTAVAQSAKTQSQKAGIENPPY
jgi:O-acetyl-ADP-ribose deacetylase (regulator of RNase III)